MPYKNIYWVKLEKRLLNDHRFYTMRENSQLIYLKFLMLAAETNNKIMKEKRLIKTTLRSKLPTKNIGKCIEEIAKNFPKFKEKDDYYYFEEWDDRVNWTTGKGTARELRGSAEGVPQQRREEKRREDKNRGDWGSFYKNIKKELKNKFTFKRNE